MNVLKIILSPLSLLYDASTSLRNLLFDSNLLKQYKTKYPVISIGNLNMGGTGKTPHVSMILELFTDKNRAVISRGYKRKSKGLIDARTQAHSTKDIGDEPMELLKQFESSTFKMIVEANRVKALKYLENSTFTPDVIVLDDGYQHRYANRDTNILLTDYNKPFFSDHILPIGTLRENKNGAKRADIVIVTKCPKNISDEEQSSYKKQILNYSSAPVYFSTIEYQGLTTIDNQQEPLDKNKKYLLVTGIANPNPIYEYLASNKIHFAAKKYSDHHNFSKKDLQDIIKKSENCQALITTEKDWVRLKETNLADSISIAIYRLKIGIKFVDSSKKDNFKKLVESFIS